MVMAHIVCADCSLCGLHAIDVVFLSYPSPSLLPLPPAKGDFNRTLLLVAVKEIRGGLSEKRFGKGGISIYDLQLTICDCIVEIATAFGLAMTAIRACNKG
jgi:hypothetical protein